jgi:hypothetical protein
MTKKLSSSPAFVANLNNKAAGHIRNGEYSRALIILSSSLAMLKDGVLRNEISAPHMEPGDSLLSGPPCNFLERETEDSFEPTRVVATDRVTTEMDEYFLYKNPVEVFAKFADSPSIVAILTYAIVYNLALCHHLEAISTDEKDNTTNLQRAIVFYNNAQRLNLSYKLDILHSLAISNNMGHAHHFLHNEPTAQLCFLRLLNAIVYLSEGGQEGRQILANNRICLKGFLTNAFYLIGSFSAAAA